MEISQANQKPTSTAKGLRQVMRSHPLLFYFVLAYAFSWIVTLPSVLSVWGALPGDYTMLLILKQWVGPALAAIVMINIVDGKPGWLSLRRSSRQWRAGWQWYLFVLLGVPLLILVGVILQPGALARFHGFTPRLLVSYPVYFVIVFFGVGLPEEIGWRGFALPRMQQRYGPLWGSLLLGVLWAFWHLLYFLLPDHGGGPGVSVATLLTSFAIFFVMVVTFSIVFTWVYNHTRGSVFIAGVMHAAIDTPQLVWVPLFLSVGQANSAAGELGLDLAALIVFGALALLLVILTRGRLGYQSIE